MRGFSDLDSLCLTEILKNLTPLDLWSMRQCSNSLRNFVDDYWHSHYFVRGRRLDLTAENNGNVQKVLKQFGKLVRHLKFVEGSGRAKYLHAADLLPLIVRNATELEEFDIRLRIFSSDAGNMMSVAQLRKLKLLHITFNEDNNDDCYDGRSINQLMKKLSLNNELETLGISTFFNFNGELIDIVSNLTNLKELRFINGYFRNVDHTSIEVLGQKLSKLQSVMLLECYNFPYRLFLASVCKSGKLRKIYVWAWNPRIVNDFIEQILEDFIDKRSYRCFVLGKPLCIYLEKEMFDDMNELLTIDNLKSIEKYGNIKICRTSRKDFLMFVPMNYPYRI